MTIGLLSAPLTGDHPIGEFRFVARPVELERREAVSGEVETPQWDSIVADQRANLYGLTTIEISHGRLVISQPLTQDFGRMLTDDRRRVAYRSRRVA